MTSFKYYKVTAPSTFNGKIGLLFRNERLPKPPGVILTIETSKGKTSDLWFALHEVEEVAKPHETEEARP